MPSNTRIKPILAFNNETLLLIRLKVPFSSTIFLTSGLKAPNYLLIRVNQFFNKFKESLDWFYSQFCSFGTRFALGKMFWFFVLFCFGSPHIRSFGHPSWHWPIRAPQRKPAVKIVPLSHQRLSLKELNINKDGDLWETKLVLVHNIPLFFFLQNTVIFFKKISLVFM